MRRLATGITGLAAVAAIGCGGGSYDLAEDADPCRVVEAEDDGFGDVTRKAIIWDSWTGVWGGRGVIEFADDSRGVTLTVSMELPGVQDRRIAAGTTIEIRQTNGDIVSFASTMEAPPIANAGYYGVVTRWNLPVALTPETLAQLGASGWQAMRVTEPTGAPMTMEIEAGDSRTMQGAARCFAGEAVAPVAPAPAPEADPSVDA